MKNKTKTEDFLGKLPKKCKKVPNWYLRSIKAGAASRNIPFLVSDHYLNKLFEKQKYKCALSGENLWFCEKSTNMIHQNASLDRIDNNEVYLEGNVQWVVKEINLMKSKFSQEKVIELCLKVAQHSLNNDHKNDKDDKDLTHLNEKFLKNAIIEYRKKVFEAEKKQIECCTALFFESLKINCLILKKIKIDNNLLIFNFPAFYKKWDSRTKTDIPKIELIKSLKENPGFVEAKLVRMGIGLKPVRTLIFDINKSHKAIKETYELLKTQETNQ